MIGRSGELAVLLARLNDPACRVLTLVGLGGVGKSRLALAAAAGAGPQFADGVVVAQLEEAASPEPLLEATAKALRLSLRESPRAELGRYLRDQRLLWLIDGADRVGPDASWLDEVLDLAPRVKVLATARAPLGCRQEWLQRVDGLTFPTDTDDRAVLNPGEYGALALFATTARRQRPAFALIDELRGVRRICRLVDGNPLALELAAGWARTLSSDEIADLIERDPSVLSTSSAAVPERQRRFATVLDETWARLGADERDALFRLASFVGGAPLWAVAAIGPRFLAAINDLAGRALARRTEDGRYVLHALVRRFVEERLQASPTEAEAAARVQAEVVLQHFAGRLPALVDPRQTETLAALDGEIDNLEVAWTWAARHGAAGWLAEALETVWMFLDIRGYYRDGERLFNLARDALLAWPARTRAEDVLAARLLARLGSMDYSLNQPERGAARLTDSLAQLTALGATVERIFSWQKLGEVGYRLGLPDYEDALRTALDLSRDAGDRPAEALALVWLAYAALQRCDLDTAQQQARESLELHRALGGPLGYALSTQVLAAIESARGDHERAREYAERTLDLCEAVGSPWGKAMARYDLAGILIPLGDLQAAQRLLREALALSTAHTLVPFTLAALLELAQWWRVSGHTQRAVELLALICHHPMGWDTAEVAREVLAELEAGAPPALADTAVARGRRADLDWTVEHLLRDWDTEVVGALKPGETDGEPLLGERLTGRERDILQRLAAGDSNRDIASALVITLGTVKWYVNQIYGKLGVHSRTQAVARSRELGLLE